MTEELVKLETAQLAQKKGYDLHVCRCGGYPDCICYNLKPTQALLQRWIREEHKIHIGVDYDRHGWSYFITDLKDNSGEVNWSKNYVTYEEAMEAGLLRVLSEIPQQED